jgi:hypothetical protein
MRTRYFKSKRLITAHTDHPITPDNIQQQITPPAPVPNAKPGDGKAAKVKKGH